MTWIQSHQDFLLFLGAVIIAISGYALGDGFGYERGYRKGREDAAKIANWKRNHG